MSGTLRKIGEHFNIKFTYVHSTETKIFVKSARHWKIFKKGTGVKSDIKKFWVKSC